MTEARPLSSAAVPRGSRPKSRKGVPLPGSAATRDNGMLEIVSQTVDQEVNLDVVYDALAALLVRNYRQQLSPPEG